MKSLESMLANYENEPRDWFCPVHQLEYGEGKPDPTRCTWACPQCEKEAERAFQAFRALHGRYSWWKNNSGIPLRYRAAVPERIKPVSPSATLLKRVAETYAAELADRVRAGEGMLLLGPPGLGKTLALAAIVNAACQSIHGPMYVVWPDALADLKAGFSGSRDDGRRQAVERLRDAPLLALDELGVKAGSEFDHSELFGLIDYRYRNKLPTLAAANSTEAEFPRMVGERISDRLYEVGPKLVLTGQSQRGRASIEGPDAFSQPPQSVSAEIQSMGKALAKEVWRDDW